MSERGLFWEGGDERVRGGSVLGDEMCLIVYRSLMVGSGASLV